MSGESIEAEIARYTAESNNWQHRAEAAEHSQKVTADALQTSQQWLIESNEKINVLTEERDAARVECEKLRKDLQEITIELEVAEDEAQVLTERLAKEQKVVLQLAEENDLLAIELDSRRTAFLQMVVEMGKVSKEMLRT